MNIEALLNRIYDLEKQNFELQEKLRKRNKHPKVKTKKEDIVNYWSRMQDECGLSVDWSEAHERCWRCGYKAKLQKCHIIPDS